MFSILSFDLTTTLSLAGFGYINISKLSFTDVAEGLIKIASTEE